MLINVLLLPFLIVLSACQNLSIIDITPRTKGIYSLSAISIIKSKSPGPIWLQQATGRSSTGTINLFIRTTLKDLVTYSILQDQNNQFTLIGYEEQYLGCALLKNSKTNSYFIKKFGTYDSYNYETDITTTKQYNVLQIDPYLINGDKQINEYKISQDCQSMVINRHHYVMRYETNFGQDPHYWSQITSWKDQKWVVFDKYLQAALTPDYLFFHVYEDYYYDYYYEMYAYNETFYYLQSIDSTQYKHFQTFYHSGYEGMNYQRRSIVFIQNETDEGNTSLLFITVQMNQYQVIPFFQFEFLFKERPEILVNDICTHVIIHGTAPNQTHVYYGFFTNYQVNPDTGQPDVREIQFGGSIIDNDNYLTLQDTLLYARNLQATGGSTSHSAYVMSDERLYPFFQDQPITEAQYGNNYWIQTAIFPLSTIYDDFGDKKMDLHHLFKYNGTYYYKIDHLNSVNQGASAQLDDLFSSQVAIPTTASTVYQSQSGFSWIYSVQVANKKTTINIMQYSEDVPDTNMIYVNKTFDGVHELYDFTDSYDCIVTYQADAKKISFFKAVVQVVGGSITLLQTFDYAKDITLSDISISQGCSAIQIDTDFYFLNNKKNPPVFQKLGGQTLADAQYDSTYTFAISGNDLYVLTNQVYVKVLTSVFYKNTTLFADDSKQKLIVITKDKLIYFRVFLLSSGIWKQIPTQTKVTGTVYDWIVSPQISDDFNQIGICYEVEVNVTTKRIANKSVCQFKKVNYITQQSMTVNYTLNNGWFVKQLNVLNKSIHIIMTRFDKKRNKTVECNDVLFRHLPNNILNQTTSTPIQISYLVRLQKRLYNQFPNNDSFFYYDSTFTLKNVTTTTTTKTAVSSRLAAKLSAPINPLSADAPATQKTSVKLLKSPVLDQDMFNDEFPFDNPNTGFYQIGDVIYQCSSGCIQCFNVTLCIKCAPGYALSTKTLKCVKCIGACQSCNSENVAECLTCRVGFFYDPIYVCAPCHSLCNSCNGKKDLNCKTCKIGFFMNTNDIQPNQRKTCLNCPLNCDVCYNTTLCKVCSFGYSNLPDGSCVKCPLDCVQCNASEIRTCINCKTGFQMISVNGGQQCQRCPDFCQICKNGICSKCRVKYNLDTQKNTCSGYCISPCRTCKNAELSKCLSCIYGYILNQTECIGDVSCSNSSNCTTCPTGYVLISKKCQQCSTTATSFCLKCSPDDPSKCLQCQRGYFLSDDSCNPCSSDCVLCYSQGMCLNCKSGYMLTIQGQASKCVKCAKNCIICTNSTTNCLSCEDGYNLIGSVCLSEKAVDYVLKLDLDWERYLNDLNFNILDQLALFTGKSANSIRVKSLKKGSVLVSGSIDVLNPADEKSLMDNLKKSYSDGAAIGGTPIISSQFTGYTPQSNNPESNSMMIIIIVAVVASVIVILGVVGYIVYRKYFAKAQIQKKKQVESDRSESQTQASTKQPAKKARSRKNGFLPKAKTRSATNI